MIFRSFVLSFFFFALARSSGLGIWGYGVYPYIQGVPLGLRHERHLILCSVLLYSTVLAAVIRIFVATLVPHSLVYTRSLASR